MGRAIIVVLITAALFLGGLILWDTLIPYLPPPDGIPISLKSLFTFFLIILLVNPAVGQLGQVKPRLQVVIVAVLAGLITLFGKALYLAFFKNGLDSLDFSTAIDTKSVLMGSLATGILGFLIGLSKIFSLRGRKSVLPLLLFVLFFVAVLYFGNDYPWLLQ